MQSISTLPQLRFGASWIASEPKALQERFLESLDRDTLLALPYLFEFWAMPHQVAPDGDWRSWVVLGGRGAGKTRAGAEWVRAQVEGAMPLSVGRASRVAL
ncbi:MAG: ATP-binding protein, partial [Pseudomonadota bacterium]